MKTIFTFAGLGVLCASVVQAKASDTFIVEEGQPRAEIVIAEQSPRTTRLAAQELQLYVEKISGAKLPGTRRLTSGSGIDRVRQPLRALVTHT